MPDTNVRAASHYQRQCLILEIQLCKSLCFAGFVCMFLKQFNECHTRVKPSITVPKQPKHCRSCEPITVQYWIYCCANALCTDQTEATKYIEFAKHCCFYCNELLQFFVVICGMNSDGKPEHKNANF